MDLWFDCRTESDPGLYPDRTVFGVVAGERVSVDADKVDHTGVCEDIDGVLPFGICRGAAATLVFEPDFVGFS